MAKRRKHIAEIFEYNKEWKENEYDKESIEEQYNEWIDTNYVDAEQYIWKYTDDNVEHLCQIDTLHGVDLLTNSEAYIVLRTCIEGCDNNTISIDIYPTRQQATKIMESYIELNNYDKDEDENCINEDQITVEKVHIE